VASIVSGIPQRASLVRSFFETRGQNLSVSARLYFNKLVYAFVRSTRKMPEGGWLHSRWHWYRFPFSMRNSVLWSPFLRAWFSPEDESAMECMLHQPDYEPVTWVTPESGAVFLDVGAYIGPYAILAARASGAAGRVLALEPDPKNRRQLDKNLALNGITNCTVVPLAAWSRAGQIGWRKAEQPDWHGASDETDSHTTEAITLDDLVARQRLDRVDWIKMDIEGGEVEALRGAQMTLQRFRPTLFIEIHETTAELRSFLIPLGYRIERELFDQPPNHHGWFLARPI
jgi:FkbM family methyltransferase